MKFEDWFNQPEAFALRCERFYGDLRMYKHNDKVSDNLITGWVEAAYQEGYEQAKLEFMQTYWDDGK